MSCVLELLRAGALKSGNWVWLQFGHLLTVNSSDYKQCLQPQISLSVLEDDLSDLVGYSEDGCM